MQIGIEGLITGAMIALVVGAYALDYFLAWLRRQQESAQTSLFVYPELPPAPPQPRPMPRQPRPMPPQPRPLLPLPPPVKPVVLEPAPTPLTTINVAPVVPPPAKNASLAQLFKDPGALANAFILQELLAPPRSSRQSRNRR